MNAASTAIRPTNMPVKDVMSANEPTVLDRVARGDQQAVQECIDRYGGLLWSLARRWCGKTGDAEDAVQDAFIRLLRRGES